MWKGPVTKHNHIYYNTLLLYAETVPLWTGAVPRNASKQTKYRFFHVSNFHTEKPIYVTLYGRRTWDFFFVHWVVLIVTIRRTHKRNFRLPLCVVWRLRSNGKLSGVVGWFCHRSFCEYLGLLTFQDSADALFQNVSNRPTTNAEQNFKERRSRYKTSFLTIPDSWIHFD
jgi:hypothetical protein